MTVITLFLFFSAAVNAASKNKDAVTCGSAIKLIHKFSGHHLHSHPIAWGSGSGQQSVTTHGSQSDKNSVWLVKEGTTGPVCEAGAALKCGSVIRLEHASTGKNLHSHLFKAPLTGYQEVSCFGEGGEGDTGDNWEVVCSDPNDDYWRRGNLIQFKHVDTGKLLYTTESAEFNQNNCGGGCPIMGQREVSASSNNDKKTKWMTGQGVYFPGKVPGESSDDEFEVDNNEFDVATFLHPASYQISEIFVKYKREGIALIMLSKGLQPPTALTAARSQPQPPHTPHPLSTSTQATTTQSNPSPTSSTIPRPQTIHNPTKNKNNN
eukprot:gene2299-4473_t